MLFGALAVAQAVNFACTFVVRRPPIADSDLYYTCISSVESTESSALERVSGDHDVGKSDVDVEYLNINQQSMPSFPEDIEKFFPNLKSLWIVESGLLSIGARDLRQLPQLIFLILRDNPITTLNSDLFSFTPELEYIEIVRCSIEKVGATLLARLDNLKYVDLTNNTCISANAADRAQVLALMPSISEQCPMICSCQPKRNNALRSKKRFMLSVRR